METAKCGKRARNFTETEKHYLFDTVTKKYLNIIENKKTDGVTVTQKNNAWDEITDIYNSQATSGPRTSKQLHALYDILKKKARKNLNDDKRNFYVTGGGTYVPKSTILDQKISQVLKPQFEPLHNRFDSSSDYSCGIPADPIITTPTSDALDKNIDNVIVVNENHTENEKHNTTFQNEEVISPVPGTSSATKRKKISVPLSGMSEKKKKCIETLTARLVHRKNSKDAKDEELFEKKKEILNLDEEIKRRQLELLQRQIENEKLTFEIKTKELEFKQIQIHNLKNKMN